MKVKWRSVERSRGREESRIERNGNHRGADKTAAETASGSTSRSALPSPEELRDQIETTSFAFRGYDVANIGRSKELLEDRRYGAILGEHLDVAERLCSEALKRNVNLRDHINQGDKTSLENFPLDVATIVAVELAQMQILEEVFDIPTRSARFCAGYSIGELSAVVFSGIFSVEQLLPVPLKLSPDVAELAAGTSMGVLFTKGPALRTEDVERLCKAVSSEGKGLIGPSAFLSPNTALLLAQGGTLDRIEARMRDYLPKGAMLRRKSNPWPPIHSPLVLQRQIADRAALMLYRIEAEPKSPTPPIVSCVTGKANYDESSSREILADWTDHPQRLWDVIDYTLTSGVEHVIHVGPAPNLIPATFARLSNNVLRHQGSGLLGRIEQGVVNEIYRHHWLSRLLPSKAALLRAPSLTHVTLEDWLLAQPDSSPTSMAFPNTNKATAFSSSGTMSDN